MKLMRLIIYLALLNGLYACEGQETSQEGACTAQAYQRCEGSDIYWFNSCDERGALVSECVAPAVCGELADGSVACQEPEEECQPQAYQGCHNTEIYWFSSCDRRGALVSYCTEPEVCAELTDGSVACQAPEEECQPQAYQGCVDQDVYWFNSCDEQGERAIDCLESERCVVGGDGAVSCGPADDESCVSSMDCEADQHCADGVCVPDICTPSVDACVDETTIGVCDASGSALIPGQSCREGQFCVEDEAGARCACRPDVARACSGQDVVNQNSCGVLGDVIERCAEGQICVEDGAGEARCQDAGPCTSSMDCEADQHCADGVCVSNVCDEPGATICLSSVEVGTCDASGSSYTPTTCENGQQCVEVSSGARCQCVADAYTACHSGDVYHFSSCGVRGGQVANCTGPERCVEEDSQARCALPAFCEDGGDCYPGDYCELATGECKPRVCAPAIRRCNGQTVIRCSDDGSGFEVADTCTGGEVCYESGALVGCRCERSGATGCHDGEIYNVDSCGRPLSVNQYCQNEEICQLDATGVPVCDNPTTCTADIDCAMSEICQSGRCANRVCLPNQRRCDQNGQILRCNARGDAWELAEVCLNGEVCEQGDVSATCSCTPDAGTVCSNGNVVNINSCGVVTNIAQSCGLNTPCSVGLAGPACRPLNACTADDECAAGFFCDNEVCLPQVCEPSERFCGEGAVRECDERGAGSVVVQDCLAGERCGDLGGEPSCGCEVNAYIGCDPEGRVARFDSCGQPGAVVEVCSEGLSCVETATGASCSDASACGAACSCAPDAEVGCYLGDVYQLTACGEPQELIERCAGEISCNTFSDGVTSSCHSSLSDPTSPGYERSCPLVQQLTYPTGLDYDCRCMNNRTPVNGYPHCVGVNYIDAGVSIGEGPRPARMPQAHINGGHLASGSLIVGVDWSSSAHPDRGFVMSVDVETGARTVISGDYLNRDGVFTSVGSGPDLRNVIDVQPGPNGSLYALSMASVSAELEVISVDPTTGARVVLWRGQDEAYAHCESGDPLRPHGVQVHEKGFAVDAMGRVYLAFRNPSPAGEGAGIIRLSADFSACAFVTRAGSLDLNQYHNQDVGGGFAVDRGFYQGFELYDGKLYTLSDAFLSLIEVDLMTGDRRRVSSASTSTGSVGAGPLNSNGIGRRWLDWDPVRGLWWSTGVQSSRVMIAITPEDGHRVEAFCRSSNEETAWRDLCLSGVLEGGYQNQGGFFVDANTGDLYVAHENTSIVKIELSTGNSARISY